MNRGIPGPPYPEDESPVSLTEDVMRFLARLRNWEFRQLTHGGEVLGRRASHRASRCLQPNLKGPSCNNRVLWGSYTTNGEYVICMQLGPLG